ncbi:MAG TPA: hypothetical protein DDW52_18190 [Planctomycetaceae bacterium]|nr:hypothetical protein [Planctomycetaceae bacterium]
MAMTKRERMLATGVGAIGVLLGGQYGVNYVQSGFETQEKSIKSTRNEIEKLEDSIFEGQLANRTLEKLREKSLPSDENVLRKEYTNWLTALGRQTGVEGLSVNKFGRTITTDAYTEYDFNIAGKCRTDEVVDFLAAFYDKDYLHSIASLSMTPIPREQDMFMMDAKIRAIALNDAPKDVMPSDEPSGRLKKSADKYREVILARNPFSPPNNPPKIETDSKLEIVAGERWSESLKASDEEGHDVEFELVGEAPEGLELRGGRLNFKPEVPGEYELLVRAIDSGFPSMTSEKKVRLVVTEPPKEEPKEEPPEFDEATQTEITAVVRGNRGPQVGLHAKTKSETMWLSVGDEIDIGTIKAKIIDINPAESFAELESDGKRWTIGMNESLTTAFARSEVD